ncbi:hypothetical protein QQ008_28805 [Fulvivirgaceae bacterium BMA10]|uniref:Polysaccharide deacetylase family protein n=1 Tax=Splendidivirga corallicola TaxID=3051826 RepID=A0ABT8KXB8_9BACT|nr:hypothetical protein [Fulvivirgaceae bacterium BMA10]
MFGHLFTLDYEIHGNGEGSPYKLMVEPTDRMLTLFDKYGAKLTIMADVGEILKFKEHAERTGKDDFDYYKIEEQLIRAIKTGHDVQLHIHSSYFKSILENGAWKQNWEEYSLADLPYERVNEMISTCKKFLEDLLHGVDDNYNCIAFRAANWSMSPSQNIMKALIGNGLKIDTSVFKFGKRNDRVKFDYSNADSELLPWPIDDSDVCRRNEDGALIEVPIYCENRRVWTFLTPNRIFRVLQASQHKHAKHEEDPGYVSEQESKQSLPGKLYNFFMAKHAWKFDFNQCTGNQLIRGSKRIYDKYGHLGVKIPVVLIGHSKIFTGINERSLEPFLAFIAENHDKYCFSKFSDFDLQTFREKLTA